MTFLRSAAGQCLIYAFVLGALFGLPGLLAFATWERGIVPDVPSGVAMVGMFFAVIAIVGAVPAMLAAAIVWRVFLRRHNGSPPREVVPYCWIMTLAGSYLLIPFWGLLVSSIAGSSLGPMERLSAGFGVVVLGFVFTVPYVAPVLYLGTWLWVRRIRPRLASGGIMTT